MTRIALTYILLRGLSVCAADYPRQNQGVCTLALTTKRAEVKSRAGWPALCLQMDLGLNLLFAAEEPLSKTQWRAQDRSYGGHSRTYGAFYLARGFSFHARHLHNEEWNQHTRLANGQSHWETAFVHLGHTLLDDWNVAIGLIDLPFGLDFRVLGESFHNQRIQEHYWLKRRKAVRLSWFRHDRTLLEIGISDSKQEQLRNYESDEDESPWTLRVSKDLPALEGTKILFSYARLEDQFHSLGFASLNHSSDGSTSFEWVRRIPLGSNEDDFTQIFRINYKGPWQNLRRWYFEYEDQRFTSWHFLMGRQQALSSYTKFSLEAGYQAIRPDGRKSQWIISGSLDVSI